MVKAIIFIHLNECFFVSFNKITFERLYYEGATYILERLYFCVFGGEVERGTCINRMAYP